MNKHLVNRPEHHPSAEHRKRCESLVGTAHMSDPEWFEALTMEELQQMDDIVFSCADCGWWCGAEECNEDDDWVCDECYKDRHPDDA